VIICAGDPSHRSHRPMASALREVCGLRIYPSADAKFESAAIFNIRGCPEQLRLRTRIIRGCRHMRVWWLTN